MRKIRAKNKNKVLIVVFIIGVIIYAFIGFALLDKPQSNASSEQILSLETQIEELTQQNQNKDLEIENLNSQIGTLEENNNNLQNQNNNLQTENQDKDKLISNMKNELENYDTYTYDIPVYFYVENEYYGMCYARNGGALYTEPEEPYVYQKYFTGWSLDGVNVLELSELVITDITKLYAVMLEDTTSPTFNSVKFGFIESGLNYGETYERTGVLQDSDSGVEYWAYDFLGLNENELNWLKYDGTITIIVDETSLLSTDLKIYAKDKAGNILSTGIGTQYDVVLHAGDIINVKKILEAYGIEEEIQKIENSGYAFFDCRLGSKTGENIFSDDYTSESTITVTDEFNGYSSLYICICDNDDGTVYEYLLEFYYEIGNSAPDLEEPEL